MSEYEIYETTFSKNLSFKLYTGIYSKNKLLINEHFGSGDYVDIKKANPTLSGFFEMKYHEDGYLCRIHPNADEEWWDTEIIGIAESFKEVRKIMIKLLKDFVECK